MRILVTSIVDLKKTAHNRLHEFVKHLSQNHEVTILCINDWWKTRQTDVTLYNQGFKDILRNVNIEYFTQREISPIYQEVASVTTLGKILRKIHHQQFDVHLNYNSLVSGYFVAGKMKSAGIKTVYDIADDLPVMIRTSPQMPALLRPAGGFFGKMVFRKNVILAERITVITESLRDSLAIPPHKIAVIPNGVDMELFNSHPSPQLKKKLALHQAFTLGYVGVLREWVDLKPVFAAVKDLSDEKLDIRLLVVGEEGGLDKNKTLAQMYGISDRVLFTGTVPYTQVPQYISCMDVCLLPFRNDAVSQNALPLKLFEYMACEKPVISTRLRGVTEAVGDRVLYASGIDELSARIRDLYGDVVLRVKAGEEGRKFVEETYSWSRICSRFEEILLEASKH